MITLLLFLLLCVCVEGRDALIVGCEDYYDNVVVVVGYCCVVFVVVCVCVVVIP